MHKYFLILTLCSTFLLQACAVGVFAAGAATGGAIAFDKRSMDTMGEDKIISFKTNKHIKEDPSFDNSRVFASTFNHIVLLAGQVNSEELKQKAENYARQEPKVKRVFNEIQLTKPITFSTQTKDTWLTTKVKSQLLSSEGLKSSQIKVITEDRTVYLLGLVTPNQAESASNIARRVNGVRKVVKLFEFTHG